MGRPVNSKVQREKTSPLHMEVNEDVFTKFKDSLAKYGYPMNVMLEIFMRQYVLGRIQLENENILKFKSDNGKTALLRTPVNREVRENYFEYCNERNLPKKVPIMAFMKEYAEGEFTPEFRKTSEKKN